MIIIEETYGEAYRLLNAIACRENKDSDECEKIVQGECINCWACIAKSHGIDLKFAAIKNESYSK
ncbi:MAG: hypothetical protein PHG06_21185 [Parabacteroides sp.]|nr:hypothetical protein [Parabacteroides sp.]